MALEDRDIFNAVFHRFTDQPIEYVMAQYAKAKRMNMEIEKICAESFEEDEEPACEETEVIEVETPEEPRQKRWTKRMLKIKDTQNSITENYIACCICGEHRQSLTAKHLANHGISVEEYKKLCGFPPNTALMSGKRLEKSKEIIQRAQQARIAKRKAEHEE